MKTARSALVVCACIVLFTAITFGGTVPITCTLTVTPSSGTAPLTVTANGSCTGGGGTLSSQIDWGDDTSSSQGATGQHTYQYAGYYTVTITATDQFQQSGSAAAYVDVTSFPLLMAAMGNGHVGLLDGDGAVQLTLDTGAGGTVAGMLFDYNGNLFTTDFTAGKVSVFNYFTDGQRLTPRPMEAQYPTGQNFGPSFNCQPESIAQDLDGNYYVGTAGCEKRVIKIDQEGSTVASFPVEIERQGADWIDISADKCTLYYTSEGTRVLRYNVCGNYQMTDFASGLHKALAVKLLMDGGVLVADNVDIHRTDASGKIIKTYDAQGEDCWVPLALDESGQSFWAADSCTSHVYHFDLESGTVLAEVTTEVTKDSLYGLALPNFGNNSFGFLDSSPQSATINAGGSTTFEITLSQGGLKRAQAQTNGSSPMLILTCSDLPKGALCKFNPAQIPVDGGTSQLTITTNNTQVVAGNTGTGLHTRYFAFVLPFVFGGTLFVRRKTRLGGIVLTVVMLAAVTLLFSCGSTNLTNTNSGAGPTGAPIPGTTPAGNYNINVNAGNGPGTLSTSVNLTVQ